MSYTKGPWKVEINSNHTSVESDNMPTWKECFPHTSSIGHITLCSFKSPESPNMSAGYDEQGAKLLLEINRANATIIAAAPEMLKALKDVYEELGNRYESTHGLKLLIAKVEGK